MSVNKEVLSAEKTHLIRTVARDAVEQTLTTMGIDAENPLEVQRDMQHLRASRKGSENTRALVKKTAVPIICVGVIAAVWGGFSDAIIELLGKRG
jgi:CTP:molybdopterin cytidylyltransferase MocA